MNHVTEVGIPKNITATGDVIATTDCHLLGFFVNSSTSGTLILKEGGSGGTALNGVTAALVAPNYYPFPASCKGGLHATVGGTLNVTFFVKAGIY